MNEEAYKKMQEAEVEYLLANGWKQHWFDNNIWEHEKCRNLKVTGHAVNTQKQWDRMEIQRNKCGPSITEMKHD